MPAKRTKKPAKPPPAIPESPAVLTLLPADRLCPNEYNPNRMTKEEYAELVAEVRRLKRLPKPVVVRPNGDGYTIVDGEHGWRAANDVGLAEVPCEVIDADDFEAMRQTYKRNQHGTHDPLLLGRMFRRMMETRNLSARAFAEEIDVSEGTVRNALLYAEAADLRNSYAPGEGERVVAKLSIRQVRCYLKLGGRLADLWLDADAELKAITDTKGRFSCNWEPSPDQTIEAITEYLRDLAGTGLFDFIRGVRGSHDPEKFKEAVAKVQRWKVWEDRWLRYGFSREEFRGYSRYFFEGNFFVRDESLMEAALAEVLDTDTSPPTFLLTAEEFAAVLSRTGKAERESAIDFKRRLSLAVAKKTGKVRETKYRVQHELLERRLEAAPDYIRASNLPPEAKFALWKCRGPEDVKEEIAREGRVSLEARKSHDFDSWAGREVFNRQRRRELREEWEAKSEGELASELASNFILYDPQKDAAAVEALAGKLAALAKPELLFLVAYWREMKYMKNLAAAIRGKLGATDEPAGDGGVADR
jgi:ParB/RepB/Spo0J family partition protein